VQLVENLDEELRLLLHHQEIIIIFLQNMIFHEENQIAQNFYTFRVQTCSFQCQSLLLLLVCLLNFLATNEIFMKN
jgi:hypothetical protein